MDRASGNQRKTVKDWRPWRWKERGLRWKNNYNDWIFPTRHKAQVYILKHLKNSKQYKPKQYKLMSRYIITKLLKPKEKKSQKQLDRYYAILIQKKDPGISRVLIHDNRARKKWHRFQLEEKNHQPQIRPVIPSYRIKGERKTFPDKGKQSLSPADLL